MPYYEKLSGQHIYLSPINPDDSHIYCRWLNDSQTAGRIGSATTVYSLSAEQKFLIELTDGPCNLAIIKRDGHQLIGNCSLFEISHIHQTATLGIFIGEPSQRNKGYGREAIALLLDHGFFTMNLNNIMLRVYSFNENAIKTYQACGFQEFGRRQQAYFFNNQLHEEIYMQILKSDYQKQKESNKAKN